jgi:hypothetical protein
VLCSLDKVVVLLDERWCGLAAVRHALPFAAANGVPLTVLFRQPSFTKFAALGATAAVAVAPATYRDEFVSTSIFHAVAVEVAEHRLPWDFHILDDWSPRSARRAMIRAPRTLLAVPRHRHRFLGSPKCVATWRSPTLLVVDCDHGREHGGR